MTSKGLDFYTRAAAENTKKGHAPVYWIIPASYAGLPNNRYGGHRRDIFAALEAARMVQPVRLSNILLKRFRSM